ncbi:hypothetical protein B1H10_04240 [candidate division KSB1 bacterium 4484_188]|nr:MAG: hypothetical protein B1H10_04240 [candidate division KSB1 bacterium 4484_188]
MFFDFHSYSQFYEIAPEFNEQKVLLQMEIQIHYSKGKQSVIHRQGTKHSDPIFSNSSGKIKGIKYNGERRRLNRFLHLQDPSDLLR